MDFRLTAGTDVLVVGGSGLLGREVTRQALAAGARVTATATATAATAHRNPGPVAGAAWRTLDIRRRDDVETLLAELRPTVVVNAAYRQDDWQTTADGGMHVAAAAAAIGARLVHVSSDAVFSGRADRYDESAPPDPVTPYGAAKAAAETAVKGLVPAAVIARTSLIIGDGDSPQEALIHRIASGATDGVLFTDDVRCPVHVTDLAAALLELAASSYAGIHHLPGADAISRHELGVLVARRDGLDESRLPAGLRATSGLPGALAVRLVDTKLDSASPGSASPGSASPGSARRAFHLRGAREFLARR